MYPNALTLIYGHSYEGDEVRTNNATLVAHSKMTTTNRFVIRYQRLYIADLWLFEEVCARISLKDMNPISPQGL